MQYMVIAIFGGLFCKKRFANPSLSLMEAWHILNLHNDYTQTSNISRTLVGNKIVDHSDVVGASPVGAAPTISSFAT